MTNERANYEPVVGKDICHKCGTVQGYGTMQDVTEAGFDLVCEKCKNLTMREQIEGLIARTEADLTRITENRDFARTVKATLANEYLNGQIVAMANQIDRLRAILEVQS